MATPCRAPGRWIRKPGVSRRNWFRPRAGRERMRGASDAARVLQHVQALVQVAAEILLLGEILHRVLVQLGAALDDQRIPMLGALAILAYPQHRLEFRQLLLV